MTKSTTIHFSNHDPNARYIRDNSMKQALNKQYKTSRDEAAKSYRELRKTNKPLAALVFKTQRNIVRAAVKQLEDQLLYGDDREEESSFMKMLSESKIK